MTLKAPVSRAPAQVVGRILDAAEAEFMAVGYESASTNAIVARFGGSKATVFRHFPTKLALLEGVIERAASRWRGRLIWNEADPVDPRNWLLAFASQLLEWITAEEPLFIGRLGISEGHKFPELDQVFAAAASRPLEAMLAERLRAWTAEGRLASPSPELDASLFMDLAIAGVVSRALYTRTRPPASHLHAHARRAVDLFLDGRRPRPGDAAGESE